YKNELLSGLNDEQKLLVARVLMDGPVLPEDKIRMQINHWGGSSDIMATLKDMKETGDYAPIAEMKDAYARKYGDKHGGDLAAALVDKLDGANEKAEAHSILLPPAGSSDEQYLRDLNKYLKTYDGVGKDIVNGWDGTGYMTQDAMNQYTAKMSDYAAHFKELP